MRISVAYVFAPSKSPLGESQSRCLSGEAIDRGHIITNTTARKRKRIRNGMNSAESIT